MHASVRPHWVGSLPRTARLCSPSRRAWKVEPLIWLPSGRSGACARLSCTGSRPHCRYLPVNADEAYLMNTLCGAARKLWVQFALSLQGRGGRGGRGGSRAPQVARRPGNAAHGPGLQANPVLPDAGAAAGRDMAIPSNLAIQRHSQPIHAHPAGMPSLPTPPHLTAIAFFAGCAAAAGSGPSAVPSAASSDCCMTVHSPTSPTAASCAS